MSRDRYESVAALLGGKRKGGAFGGDVRVSGTLTEVEYVLWWERKKEIETERYGLFGTKERRTRNYVPRHVFQLRSEWLDQPGTVEFDLGGHIIVRPATPGQEITLSDDQSAAVADALRRWPGIQITNLGLEWVQIDEEQTAQEISVNLQGLAGLLRSLHPDDDEQDESWTRSLVRRPLESLRRMKDPDEPSDAEPNGKSEPNEPPSDADV